MDMTEYIYPQLLFIIPFLNLTGWWIKHKTNVANKLIPLILGAVAVLLSTLYIHASMQTSVVESVGAGIIQGVFLAATAVYANQITKTGKEEI
jgi:uncharacterized membrane protein